MRSWMMVEVLALAGVCFAGGGEVVVDGASSEYVIVCPTGSPPSLQYAARELQVHVWRMTGAELPIVATMQSPAIVVKDDPGLPPSAYRITRQGLNIEIAGGNTPTPGTPSISEGYRASWGTLNGVTRLLNEWGCRWYWPGPLGEIIPSPKALCMPDADMAAAPLFAYRQGNRGLRTNYLWDQAKRSWVAATSSSRSVDGFNTTWAGRNGLGNDDGDAHNHAWRGIMGYSDGNPSPWAQACPDTPPKPGQLVRCGHPEFMPLANAKANRNHLDYAAQLALMDQYREISLPEIDAHVSGSLGVPHAGLKARVMSRLYVPEPGERVLVTSSSTQVCTSNPNVVRAFVDWLDYTFTKNPDRAVVSISMNDGSDGFCNCVNCRALDGTTDPFALVGDLDGDRDVDDADVAAWESLPDDRKAALPRESMTMTGPRVNDSVWQAADCTSEGQMSSNAAVHGGTPLPYMADRIIAFYNAVAAGMAERHPDKKVEGYLYGQSAGIPRRPFTQHPNLRLCVVFNWLWMPTQFSRAGQERFLTGLIEKGARPGDITVYDIGGWRSYGLPQPTSARLVERAQMFKRVGVAGEYTYQGISPEHWGFEMFLWSRLFWNTEPDVEALRRQYFDELYGGQGKLVDYWYRSVEQARTAALEKVFNTPGDPDFRGLPPTFQLMATSFKDAQRLATLRARIKVATEREANANLKARFESLLSNIEMANGFVDALRAIVAIGRSGVTDENLAAYKAGFDLYWSRAREVSQRWCVHSYIDLWYDHYNDPSFKPFSTDHALYRLACLWPSVEEARTIWCDDGWSFVQMPGAAHYWIQPDKTSKTYKTGLWWWTDSTRGPRTADDPSGRYMTVASGNSIQLRCESDAVSALVGDSMAGRQAVVHVSCEMRATGLPDYTTYGAVRGDFAVGNKGETTTTFKPEYRRSYKLAECGDWIRYDNFVYLPRADCYWRHSFNQPSGGQFAVRKVRVTYYLVQ